MADTVEVKTTVKFKAWRTPNFAIIDLGQPQTIGIFETPKDASIHVKELSDEALAAMAEQWLEDLYNAADKRSPFQLPVVV